MDSRKGIHKAERKEKEWRDYTSIDDVDNLIFIRRGQGCTKRAHPMILMMAHTAKTLPSSISWYQQITKTLALPASTACW